jgi:hypothetical protein
MQVARASALVGMRIAVALGAAAADHRPSRKRDSRQTWQRDDARTKGLQLRWSHIASLGNCHIGSSERKRQCKPDQRYVSAHGSHPCERH